MQPKRTGGFAFAAAAAAALDESTFPVSAARKGRDSSHGNAREIPAPRRNVRRVTGRVHADWLRAFITKFLPHETSNCTKEIKMPTTLPPSSHHQLARHFERVEIEIECSTRFALRVRQCCCLFLD